MFNSLRSLWRHRHFVPAAVSGEFKSRVTRSRIGTLWFILQPLAMATIYVLVLSNVLGAKIGGVEKTGSYAVYLLVGLIGWSLFSEILTRCINMFIEYANPMKKIAFPKIYIPVVVFSSATINSVLFTLAVGAIIALYGYYPQPDWLSLVAPLGITVMLAFGLGIFLGALNVFTRDIAQVMMVVMSFWFWLTPIVYVKDMLGEEMQALLNLNPMTPVVSFFHDVIVYNSTPDFHSLIYPAALGAGLLVFSLFIFWRASAEIVEAL